MTRPIPLHEYTYQEYLSYEAASNVRHEFLDGEIYAMAGGSPEHAALAVAITSALSSQLTDEPCRVFSSDLRIRVAATGLATYPDVSVVCGPLRRDTEEKETVLNPVLLVEILSPSTERYDRGEKFEQYKQIPSLREYVLVSQKETHVEIWTRDGDSWSNRDASGGARLALTSIPCELVLDDLYDGVFEL